MSKSSFRAYRALPIIGYKLHLWVMDDYGNDVMVDAHTIQQFTAQET